MAGTIATDGERRAIAARIRERGLSECADMAYALGNGCKIGARCEDCRDWMAERLALLVEPQADRDALTELADRVELLSSDPSRCGSEACAYFGHPDCDCDGCAAYSSDEPCLDLAAKDAARRIREAVDACEGGSDAPRTGDDERGGVDAHDNDCEPPEGHYSGEAYPVDDDDYAACCWVREHGGLESVKDGWNEAVNLCATIGCEPDGTVTSMLEAAGECTDIVMKRLMPEVYEWPRFEDGEPVRIGGEFMGKDGKTYTAKQIQFIGKCFSLYDFCDRKPQFDGFYGERVRRPAPKARDADGVEVHKGDEVWSTAGEFDGKRTVSSVHIDPGDPPYAMFEERQEPWSCLCCLLTHERPVLDAEGNRIEPAMDVWWVCEGDERGIHAEKLHVESIGEDGFVTCNPFNYGTWVELEPSELYVYKPVLAADGKPLREGETVWRFKNGDGPYHVQEIRDGVSVCVEETSCEFMPKKLTHERPESWERLRKEMDMAPYYYCRDVLGMGKKELDETSIKDETDVMRDDLVRRAKALSERDAS